MTLGLQDGKRIGRYAEGTVIPDDWSDYMNFGLESVSAALPHLVAADTTERDAYWGAPATAAERRALQDAGATTIRLDTGWVEQYYAGPTDGGSNPGGFGPGWFPIAGRLPKARLTKSAAQNTAAAANVLSALTFDVETFDASGIHSLVTDTSRITAPAGLPSCVWRFNARARINSNSAAMTIQFAKNGTTLPETAGYALGNATQTPLVGISADIVLAGGEYVEVMISSNGTTQTITVGNCFLEGSLIGPR